MKRFRAAWAASAIGMTLWASIAGAAGYSIYEQGARALGMGGANTASTNNAEALFFNPANMTWQKGTQVLAGGTLLQPFTSFAGHDPFPGYGVTEEMESQSFFPPTLYLTSRFREKLAWGVGLNSPFGLGVEWKDADQFTGRYIVTKAELQTLNANASVAWRFLPNLSVAAGVDAMYASVELNNRTQAVIPGGGGARADVAAVKLESDFTPGYGWNAAVAYRPTDQLQLGAYYRSKVVVDVDGDASFKQILTGNPVIDASVAANLPPAQGVKTVLRFPAMWSLGAAWLPAPDWTLEANLNYVEWSVFTDLPIEFQTTPSRNRTIVENYENAGQIRLGAEHRLETWAYRFGYYYDDYAAPAESMSPLLPDAKRNGVTLGLGWWFGANKQWALDIYELALFVDHRGTEGVNRDGYDGEYKSYVNAAGLSLALNF